MTRRAGAHNRVDISRKGDVIITRRPRSLSLKARSHRRRRCSGTERLRVGAPPRSTSGSSFISARRQSDLAAGRPKAAKEYWEGRGWRGASSGADRAPDGFPRSGHVRYERPVFDCGYLSTYQSTALHVDIIYLRVTVSPHLATWKDSAVLFLALLRL